MVKVQRLFARTNLKIPVCRTYRTITQKRLQLELPTENSVYSQENRNRAGNYAHLTSENGKLAALTSGRPAFQQHTEHAEGNDTTPRLAHSESPERRVYKPQLRQKRKRSRSPAGPRCRRKRTHAVGRASTFSGYSSGGNFAGSTRPCCGRGREGHCFGVRAAVCDFSPKAECVPTFARESERGAFVPEVLKTVWTMCWKRWYDCVSCAFHGFFEDEKESRRKALALFAPMPIHSSPQCGLLRRFAGFGN